MSDIEKAKPQTPNMVEVTVDQLLTPEQFQQRCQDLGENVIYTLLEVMMNGKSEGARVRAAENLLKYGFGDGVKRAGQSDSVLDSMPVQEQLEAAREAVKQLEAKVMEEQVKSGPED